MKFMSWGKDGGPESNVSGYWLVELKGLFSIVLLRFDSGTRDAFHNHSFDAVSWVLKGRLVEHYKEALGLPRLYTPSLRPVITRRSTFHKVFSVGTTWVLSFRGPWNATWNEYVDDRTVTLTNGRKEV